MDVKPLSTVVSKWARRASAAGTDYEDGVSTTKKDWAGNTAAAKDSYASGVQEAIAGGRFEKGVREAGTDKWRSKAASKGATRYPEGVRDGQSDYENGMGPVLDTLSRITLGPRGPRGSPRNYDRVKQVGDALHKLRVG